MGKFAGEIVNLPGRHEWLKQGEVMRLMRGASCPQKVSRNITVAKSDKYLCWKKGCVDRWLCFLSRLSDTLWQVGGYCSGFFCHLKPSSTVCPAAPSPLSQNPYPEFLLGAGHCPQGCWALPPGLLHCSSTESLGCLLTQTTAQRREMREKQFHKTLLGCFSNLTWLIISLKLPKEGAVFWVYFLFHLHILPILKTDPGYQKVSEVFIQNEQTHGMG